MKKRISSPFTFFFKVVTPCVWTGIGLFMLSRVFVEPYNRETIAIILFIILWTGVPFLINYRNNFPLKRVSLGSEFLFVSNYIKEIRIPLSKVDYVEASSGWWGWPSHRVVIMLEDLSEFGDKILIIPGFYHKDVVQELLTALAANRPTR